MVNTSSSNSRLLRYTVQEYALVSKTGRDEDCEDALYIGPHFVAVIDGATSKTERRWDGQTGGRIGAYTIKSAFDQVPYDATARQTIDILTAALQNLYERYDDLQTLQANPVQRAIASLIVVSFCRNEVWFVGDCQCLLNHEQLTNNKMIDEIASRARSAFLEVEICTGKTVEELLRQDTGRAFILPLLERQMVFQNNPSAGPYWFSVLDGFQVPDEGIRIQSLPYDIRTIVLASDGYPYLKDNLEESEQALQEILQNDPLLFRAYKTTKGMKEGDISFDDRTYIKMNVEEETNTASPR